MEGSDRTLLSARNLLVGHGGRALLPPLALQVRRGEIWGLVGVNGSGKTTLLRTLLGLLPRVGGHMELAPGVTVGYVPQRTDNDPQVPGHAFDLVAEGLDRGWSFLKPFALVKGRARVRQTLRDVGMDGLGGHPFSSLSEGQKQRVLIAGALVGEPDLLVLDEPTSAVDQAGEHAIFHLLDELREGRDLGVMVVSHHMALLLDHVTHLLFVDRECQVVRAGVADEVLGDACVQDHYGVLAMGAFHDGGRP